MSLQVRHFGPYQDAAELLEARITELEATLPEKGSGTTQHPKSSSNLLVGGGHKEQIAAKGENSLEFYGMIHTPVDNWKRIPEAAAALEKNGRSWERCLRGIPYK